MAALREIVAGGRVAVIGAGRSGVAAARMALYRGASIVSLFDEAEIVGLAGLSGMLVKEGIELRGGGLGSCSVEEWDMAVLSPGVPPSSPLVRAMSGAGVPIVGELEFASWWVSREAIVAITGTNGKTTTTELVVEVLEGGGIPSVACGNHGRPLSEVLLEGIEGRIYVVEASSFQLEATEEFRPRVAIWTNFAADHLDRYDSEAEYKRAKLRIFRRQTSDDIAIVRGGEDVGELEAERVSFSGEEGADTHWSFADGWIRHNGDAVFDYGGTHLRGRHNAENLMAALAVGEVFSISPGHPGVKERLRTYRPPRHRCELVGIWDGIEYLNDSKATNLHAMESSLRALDPPILLIAGGKDKGLDYAPLGTMVGERARAVIVIGEIAEQLRAQWGDHVPVHLAEGLAEAVLLAGRLAESGDTVLFSPGTSSFDMFRGYEERGERFCELVNRRKF